MDTKQKIRALAIAMLDDDEGISEDVYNKLCDLLDDFGITDITSSVGSAESGTGLRFYLPTEHGLS